MKILTVKFKNLSAMSGEWEIRFDQPPLADTGLFAVVGPNGSGKTTILDALTVALYGETPRLKNPELGIMNWQADDAHSEVTFAVGGNVYRSNWSVNRATGSPAAPEMRLVSLNGQETVLEDRVIKVRERVAELTGLDFKRFCRSVLLAQGEFTAFLSALDSERAEILEKIIGPEITRELEASVRSRAAAEEERLLQLKEAAAGFPPLDKTRQDELRASLEQAREDLRETDRGVEELEAQAEWNQRMEQLTAAEREAAEALVAAEARHAQAALEAERLEQARKAAAFEAGIRDLDELTSRADQARSDFNRLETEVQSYQERTRELEELLRENRQALEQTRKQLEARGGDLQQAQQLDREIALQSEQFREALAQYEALERAQKDKLQQQAEVERQMVEVQKRREELRQWLEAHTGDARLELDLPVTEELAARLQTIQQQLIEQKPGKKDALKAERRSERALKRAERATQRGESRTEKLTARKTFRERRLGELLEEHTFDSLLAAHRDRKNRLAACKKLIKIGRKYRELAVGENPPTILAHLQVEREALGQSLELEQAHLAKLEETVRRRDQLRKFAPDRSLLRSGTPCPLCGSAEHPYVDPGLPDFGNIDSVWQDQQEKVAALQQQLESLNARATALRSLVKALEAIQGAWAKACDQAGGDWAITEPDAVLEEIRSRKRDLKNSKWRVRSVRWHKWRTERVGRALEKKLGKLSREMEARDRLREQHELHLKTVKHTKGESQRLRQEQQEIQEELETRLRDCGEQIPGPGMETDLIQGLKKRWQAYHSRWLELGASSGRLVSLETSKDALPRELDRLKADAATLATEIQAAQSRLSTLQAEREGLFGSFDPVREGRDLEEAIDRHNAERLSLHQEIEALRRLLVEKQPALPEAEREALQSKIAVEESELNILAQARGAGMESVDTVREHLRVLAQEDVIVSQLATAVQVLPAAQAQHEAARTALEAARAERAGTEAPELLSWKIADGNKRRELLLTEIEDSESTLREWRELERDYRDTLRAIAEQEKIRAQAISEQKALESEDPTTTKQKLQSLMMERLVERTNQHLELLSGRYFVRPDAEQGLGLEIEDTLQGRTHRTAKTLSGGESFLVSLCLALGLSEMAGNGRKIESLFLDEGFGTLDDEMLYKVLAALKGLRANGKMVGIISHVKRLAEEIPTQIRVEKQPGGSSRITIVA
jgi:DNA repair protein SbcC/Rad50